VNRLTRRTILAAAPSALALASGLPAFAQKKYDTGVTDSEIKLGHTAFYTGPASSYGTIGKAMAAYYRMVNDQGGVNGRKITFLSYDDAYSPPKTVEQTRRLVEQDGVFLMASPLGTPTNSATQHYLNQKKVPQLFVATGATKWDDPKHFPWTIGWQPNYQGEGRIYASYILKERPNGKVGVLYQNDDFGKDYLKGVKDGLGDKAKAMFAVEASYETTDPTVDSLIVSMKAAGCDVFVNTAIPKFAAQAIRKAYDIDWHPQEFVSSVGSSIAGAIRPAGFEAAKGIISAAYQKDPADPQWQDDPAMKAWRVWMDKYNPHVDKSDYYAPYGYNVGFAVVQILKQCGDNLTRENIMKQASHLDMELPLLLPGIRLKTSPTDLRPIKQMRLVRFDGQRYVLFSDVLASE
jgi:branched-chain amino acid transport system substrate-binding protein